LFGPNACVEYVGNTNSIGEKDINLGYITTPQQFVDASYKFRLVYRMIDIGEGNDVNDFKWFLNYSPTFNSELKLGQDYKANLTAARNQNNSMFWLTGSFPDPNSNELLWLTASNKPAGQFLNLAYFTNPFISNTAGSGFVQVFTNNNTDMFNLGYTQPNIPAIPQKGDYIRFEHDKDKQARILDIKPFSNNNGNSYSIGIWPWTSLGPATVYDHFTLSRVIDDGNYIVLNKFYPASGSVVGELTGFARPENLTQEIQDNFGSLTTQLVKDGVLNQ
jgi:hypothetical protein